MATNKNITMKQFNGTDYDTLYPKTKVEQVEGAYTQQQTLADSTKTMFGLGTDAVPDDVFSALSKAVTKKVIMEHTWEVGSETPVFVDLTTIDYTKRIIVEMGCGENTSSGFSIGFYKINNSIASGGTFTRIDLTSLTQTTISAWPVSDFVAYPNTPTRFELFNTGNLTWRGTLSHLQFYSRYSNKFNIYTFSADSDGIKYMKILPGTTGNEGTNFKIYELS